MPSHRIAPIADNVSFAAAASLPVAGLTALRTLRHGAPLLGKRVLITGAAGGVGNLAVQLAARSGARVTAVVGSAERARVLDGLGAAEIVTDIDQAQGRFALILEAAGGALAEGGDRPDRGEGHGRDLRQFVGRADRDQFPPVRRAPERAHPGISLFHLREPRTASRPISRCSPRWSRTARCGRVVSEYDWRDINRVGPQLRDRQIAGKAVFHIGRT